MYCSNPIYQPLNWKKLHTDIQAFATAHNLELEELNTTFPKGKLTTYRMMEDSKIFCEIKHSKPLADYGSKIRIYTKTERQISIISKVGWLGKQSLRIDGEVSDEVNRLMQKLAKLTGSFTWTTEVINPEWPEALRGEQCLKFECKQVDLAAAELASIRALHLLLSGETNPPM